ncbi:thymidylate kinase [Anaerobacterium chartisolvens]|uniref:Thymidylate kinase n=1 Tax=Anaerobacterium chartisolvens TaxID=1297424 RepID=A0A369BCE9_9FIRM|nr:dTMP kinase [Anaerobacterium chartisolvens]RCX18278.1 thymidylate kinase [Anaerobacterium chartisolvens]
MKKGLFITVEGMDGSGKTTQIELMSSYLKDKGYEVVLTREPGGTIIGEKIRNIILDPHNSGMCDAAEMLLYASARAQLVREVIKPSVDSGKIVICDRFADSSYVYQGFGRGIDFKAIEDANRAALDGVSPDITIFLDIRPELALGRRLAATGADRIENEKIEFHLRVYSGYKKLASLYCDRIKAVDSSRSIEDIAQDIRVLLDGLLL